MANNDFDKMAEKQKQTGKDYPEFISQIDGESKTDPEFDFSKIKPPADDPEFDFSKIKEPTQKSVGLFSRIGTDIGKRFGQEGVELAKQAAGAQTLPETVINTMGAGAGLIGDIGGEAMKSASSLVPQFIKDPAKQALHKLLQTDEGQAGLSAAKKGRETYDQWAKQNPRTAKSVESILSIGTNLPPAKGAKMVGEVVSPIAEKAGKETLEKTARGISKASVKIAPEIDPGLVPVVKMAQKYNIPLSLDEVTGSRALKTAQKAGQDLPFSGQQAFRERQMSAFNRALLNTVGIKGDKITPEVMGKRFAELGKKFDNLGKGKTYNLTTDFSHAVSDIRKEAEQTTTKDAVENFDNAIKEIMSNVDPHTGNISGEKLGKLRAKINERMRKTNNYDTKQLLGDLENAIIEKMISGDPKMAKDFANTKREYKNMLVLEPLVQKGKAGTISPIKLSDRVAKMYKRAYTTGEAGDIGELSRIGRELLPELGGSDTQAKAIYNVGAAGGALSHPIITALLLGGNRGFQDLINRNQHLIGNIAKEAK